MSVHIARGCVHNTPKREHIVLEPAQIALQLANITPVNVHYAPGTVHIIPALIHIGFAAVHITPKPVHIGFHPLHLIDFQSNALIFRLRRHPAASTAQTIVYPAKTYRPIFTEGSKTAISKDIAHIPRP